MCQPRLTPTKAAREELDAAREAGLQTRLIDRLDDYPLPRTGQAANGHERVENFQQIQL